MKSRVRLPGTGIKSSTQTEANVFIVLPHSLPAFHLLLLLLLSLSCPRCVWVLHKEAVAFGVSTAIDSWPPNETFCGNAGTAESSRVKSLCGFCEIKSLSRSGIWKTTKTSRAALKVRWDSSDICILMWSFPNNFEMPLESRLNSWIFMEGYRYESTDF